MGNSKKKPIVAVVGRPNVGKSTLFNALAGEKISIVKDTPGITRDRIYADIQWLNWNFTIIDTGGIERTVKTSFFHRCVSRQRLPLQQQMSSYSL